MTVAILLGAPGAGKGTQAPILAASLGVPASPPATCSGPRRGRQRDRAREADE